MSKWYGIPVFQVLGRREMFRAAVLVQMLMWGFCAGDESLMLQVQQFLKMRPC